MSNIVRDSLKKSVKGSVLIILSLAVSMILWLLARLVIIRNASMDDAGLYFMSVALVSIASLFASMGLMEGTTKYISTFIGKDRPDDAAKASISSLRAGFFSGLFVSIILYALADAIAVRLFYKPNLADPLKAMALLPLFTVVSNVYIGVLRGFGDIRPRAYILNIGHPLIFIFLLGGCMLYGFNIITISYAYVSALAVCTLLFATYGYSTIRINPFSTSKGGFGLEIVRFSIPLLGTALMGVIFSWTDTLMLGRYAQTDSVAIYNVAVSLARITNVTPGAYMFVFLPIAAELYAKGQINELNRTYQVMTKWIFYITLPLLFVLFMFPEMTITVLFKEIYLPASGALRMLCFGFLINVLVGTLAPFLIVMGKTRFMFNVNAMGTLLNIILNYVFIKHLGYGIMGAATATSIAFFFTCLIYMFVTYRISGAHPFTIKYMTAILASVLVGGALYVIAKLLPLYMWMMPVYLLLFLLCYSGLLLILRGVEGEDLQMLRIVLNKVGISGDGVIELLGRFVR